MYTQTNKITYVASRENKGYTVYKYLGEILPNILRARSSVDRTSDSGSDGRGFESLRAHFCRITD